MEDLRQFEEYLRTQTSLSQRSVRVYLREVRLFFRQFSDDSIENINRFIVNPIRKYAMKHYLIFKGRQSECSLLKKVKIKPVEKEGTYLSREELKKIVFSIPDERYRMVALIQFITGVRASEVLKLKKDDFEMLEDMLKIRIIGKGGTERHVFIPQPYASLIWNYVQSGSEYPFLKGKSSNFLVWVDNNYNYYYRVLKKTAEKLGYPNFGTHDFRRNFIDTAYSMVKDIRVVRGLAGHARPETTLRYFNKRITEEEFKEIVKKMQLL